ncbi:phosphoadenosine phosphosulfate reductase family protein [Emticicia sp. BO119]|uniref:phosphoadenosine phosphosulfate reductase domain-containing protein n=1 Tax=Emticicia sp. BO119 TaxID=2757768 RepID=UPI0015EFE0BF|nr:phosphoadenosine phosphosulfate reductase family protein [Emticicia sp. BO119]MBA4849003.1 phosphoadenosine phosphosulfate reductase family protein [Emticicia sp. BO119]
MVNIQNYDKFIVAFSGGKDSIACVLHLLDVGVDKSKIELWHHIVDGKGETLMDWEITEDYCRQFAKAFQIPIYFSWKVGGFAREMLRKNSLTAPTVFETPTGKYQVGGKRGKKSTRLKFPQVSADLSVRWCSAYLKIDVFSLAIRNQKRFTGVKTLVISGERGQESAARARYKAFEPDRANLKNKRIVDRWRPILEWKESKVWITIKRHKVVVHPCYYLGFSRCSCKFCIFGNADQFASANKISPDKSKKLQLYERRFKVTMKRNISLSELIANGSPYKSITQELIQVATSKTYSGKIFIENWVMPAGAFGKSCGPT